MKLVGQEGVRQHPPLKEDDPVVLLNPAEPNRGPAPHTFLRMAKGWNPKGPHAVAMIRDATGRVHFVSPREYGQGVAAKVAPRRLFR